MKAHLSDRVSPSEEVEDLGKVLTFNPNSVYELVEIIDRDQSNLNKLINFFEELGAL